ncbi:hypothetical protein [Amycolatopsis sp. NPDC051102]|uniref:hypothetical protein n=1 Tax=Amycolatopsis sp. NPDC051102 TaxID=3155163 RepID=UPI003424C677
MDDKGLEQQLTEAAARGAMVDLRTGDPTADDPAQGARWPASRTVPAELIARLVTGTQTPPRAVRLAGARVTGRLDLESAILRCPLVLEGCSFEEPVTLEQAQAATIRLPYCHVPAIAADELNVRGALVLAGLVASEGGVSLSGAQVDGHLDLDGATLANAHGPALNADSLTVGRMMFCRNGFTAEGEVGLIGAQIGGNLEFDGAVLTANGRYALNADSLTVDQSVYCRNGFTAVGEVSLLGASVAGSLDFGGATLNNACGYALYAGGLTVGRGMFCRHGFTALGEVNVLSANVGDNFDFADAQLRNFGGYALNGGNLTVERGMFCRNHFTAVGETSLLGAQIGGSLVFTDATLTNPDGLALDLESARAGALFLTPREPPGGIVDLTNARVTSFHDAVDGWPTAMRLRGFTYDVLENDTVTVRARLKWLARHQGGYAPGLYDQLAAAYRRDGHTQAARRVGIAKQWRRRQALNLLGKAWNWLLYLTVGYGYRTWLAGLWLAGLVAVGTAVFAGAYPGQMKAASATVPEFQPAAYTLDVMLPVVDLGQKKNWFPQDTAQVWSWVLTGAGWVLTTAVVAGLTNALKRD